MRFGGLPADRQARKHLRAGTAALRRRRWAEAVERLREAAGLAPDSYLARVNLGLAYYYQEKYTPAIAEFSRATELDPERPQAWLNLAAAETALRHLEKAHDILQRLVAKHPDHPDLHYNLATLHLRRGAVLETLAELELELANNPRHRPAQRLLRELQTQK